MSFFDLRTKKRISEAKEELKEPKKSKKDDIKETKELKKVKKGEVRDLRTKTKEDSKENRKTRKEKCVESQLDSESDILNDLSFQEGDSEDLQSDNREEKLKIKSGKDKAGLDAAQDAVLDKHLDSSGSADEDADVRGRRNKKKPRKAEELKESKKLENKNLSLEKKNSHKKQRNQDKRSSTESDNLTSSLAQTQKSSRVGLEERGLRSNESAGEVSTPGGLVEGLCVKILQDKQYSHLASALLSGQEVSQIMRKHWNYRNSFSPVRVFSVPCSIVTASSVVFFSFSHPTSYFPPVVLRIYHFLLK